MARAAFPPEGIVPLPIQQGVLAKAPHPNAAKLFAEFMTSQEGQQLFLDARDEARAEFRRIFRVS